VKLGLDVEPPLAPMEATLATELPRGDGWQYEPKWDGFRCVAFRSGERVELQSKSCKPLGRYFPEIEQALLALDDRAFVLDGELVALVGGRPSFENLQLRLHPARSRVERLAREQPATLVAFDLLVDRGESLVQLPLRDRRARLEAFARRFAGSERLTLSPVTFDAAAAQRWLDASGGGIDGVVAKRTDAPYLPGERGGMQKVKRFLTADCVVGGFRHASGGRNTVGSLLLGLYENGVLHYVGFTSAFSDEQRRELAIELERLAASAAQPKGFTGRVPGPSRWSRGKTVEWVPLPHETVVEVEYDQLSGTRFRHATQLLRRRPDKAPRQCTFDQLARVAPKPKPISAGEGPRARRRPA
jgi:ATP-dependent DNA ligase